MMNVLGIWFDLVWKFKNSTILIFTIIFLCKNQRNSSDFSFNEENERGRAIFIIDIF